jgi:hypothetical protein
LFPALHSSAYKHLRPCLKTHGVVHILYMERLYDCELSG